ncbi:MAG: alpha-L-fucosidase [Akkermansiaceae bacterium]|nr:alpha-L-fucosidase [Akkermansiaceae bacterium]
MKRHIITACLLAASSLHAQTPPATAQAIQDWQKLGYGMFIHFGMSTFIANEYGTGKEASTTYAPSHLDVDQWIRVARDAGMKYAVLTAKHVAGHCLWDSKVRFRGKEFDHDVATSGNRTDVIAEYVKACRKYDVMPGLYWCFMDKRNNSRPPARQDYGTARAKLPDDFFQLAKDQTAELIRLYPDVAYYWLDIPAYSSPAQRRELYDHIKRLRPGTIVLFNHGAGKPKGPMTIANSQVSWPSDILNTERWPLKPGWFTAKQSYQNKTYQLGYEHCDTICKKWFWNEGDQPRPVEELLNIYRDVRAGGGNLLLNVPPDRTGRIPQYHVKALLDLKKAIDAPAINK